uniref:synapse-associated protein 1 isoform X1 n=1 Tax=Ciona intestinalis TaxID=7719 RepID=UPI00089DB2F7|nr:synapse-associated protein 1 isoform X1 [Ciona intestinalis]|eukprot:XP_018669830.1 synapse-associated protein 1 isoform X1 [Ciona intestinalis]
MFKSNLSSSISGWFANTFQPTSEDKENEEIKEENENQTEQKEEKPVDSSVENKESDSTPDADDDSINKDDATKDAALYSVIDFKAEEVQKKLAEETQKVMSSAMSLGNYLYGVASVASKKVTTTMNETAVNLKKTVEEKTILGDLNREQKEFIQKKRELKGDLDALPPWCGYQEEEIMKKQILALSTDTRNFLRSPPSGVQFNFEYEQSYPVAMATLKEDENLKKMRFNLVPTKVKEEMFWRNYFYRVSLIKQSAQLSTLTDLQKSDPSSSASSASSIVMVGSTATGTISRSSSTKSLNRSDPGSGSTNSPVIIKHNDNNTEDLNGQDEPPTSEFVSDAFDPSTLNPEDLEREMRELGMDGGEGETEEVPEWEKELQKELQDYEVVGGENKDETWEREIEDMLSTENVES